MTQQKAKSETTEIVTKRRQNESHEAKGQPLSFCSIPQILVSCLYLSMALQPFVGPWPLFHFLDLFTQPVGLLGGGSARRTLDSTNAE
jgi:hypothetical protein